jgi:hypothetical protein
MMSIAAVSSGKKSITQGCKNQAQDIVGDRFNDVPEAAVIITFLLDKNQKLVVNESEGNSFWTIRR